MTVQEKVELLAKAAVKMRPHGDVYTASLLVSYLTAPAEWHVAIRFRSFVGGPGVASPVEAIANSLDVALDQLITKVDDGFVPAEPTSAPARVAAWVRS